MMERSANKSLLVVGSVALDDIDGPHGPQTNLVGGSASFFAIAASYFTKNVSIVAVIGDNFPAEAFDTFATRGIDVSGIEKQPGETFHWVGRYADDLESRETLDTRLGVFADFQPKLADNQRSQDLLFLANIDPVLQTSVLEQAKSPSLVGADTMNFWIEGKRADLATTLSKIDTLIINDEEARLLAGTHNLVAAATTIQAMGPTSVVIKRADAGALLFSEGGAFFAPALPLSDVKDPTGAGDTFAGGFFGYLAYTPEITPQSIRTAMIAGSVMASFCVEEFSYHGLTGLSLEQIQGRIEAFDMLSYWERVKL